MTDVCQNIGPAQRRLRRKIGIVSLGIAAGIGAFLLSFDAARGWRMLALPPIWIGALSLVEAQTRTCVMLAARGLRNMDAGNEPITDASDRTALRRRSQTVHVRTAVVTLLLTAALLALP